MSIQDAVEKKQIAKHAFRDLFPGKHEKRVASIVDATLF